MTNLLREMDFGNEAGDDADPADLATYFVEQSVFRPFLSPDNKILVATAKKGVGKSALLQWAFHNLSKADPDALVIKCRGADLVRSTFNLTTTLTTPSDHIRDWMTRLCALINRHLASELRIALTDDKITLVETAELEGFKSRNLVSCLLDRFDRLLGDRQPKKFRSANEVELLKRTKNRKVWIVIDDLDATYQNTEKESLDLGTFFTACRYLTQDLQGIYFRVSMRTDVWALIRRYDESLDKMEQYVFEILWYQEDFRRLLYLRIKRQIEKSGGKLPYVSPHVSKQDAEERLLERVFAPKMDWAEKQVESYKVIYTLSYERPRWAIQLSKLAQASALRRNRNIIIKEDVDAVWGELALREPQVARPVTMSR